MAEDGVGAGRRPWLRRLLAFLAFAATGVAALAALITNMGTITGFVYGVLGMGKVRCTQEWQLEKRIAFGFVEALGRVRPVSVHLSCVHRVTLENHAHAAALDVAVQLEGSQDADEVQIEPLGEAWRVRDEHVKDPLGSRPLSHRAIVIEGKRLVKGVPVTISLWRRCPPVLLNLTYVASAATANGGVRCEPEPSWGKIAELNAEARQAAENARARGLMVNPPPDENPLVKIPPTAP